jgi:hypothetical protein
MRVQDAISFVDLERLAKRRLPRILFECIESGVEDEYGIACWMPCAIRAGPSTICAMAATR